MTCIGIVLDTESLFFCGDELTVSALPSGFTDTYGLVPASRHIVWRLHWRRIHSLFAVRSQVASPDGLNLSVDFQPVFISN